MPTPPLRSRRRPAHVQVSTLVSILATLLAGGTAAVPARADSSVADPLLYQDARLSVRLRPRTPQQIAAFYEARGFPVSMLERLRRSCFITVRIHNRSRDILWLDLANWEIRSAHDHIARRDRAYWNRVWQALNSPLPSRATFRWTLLPEKLDFRPDEAEGGNLILPPTDQPFEIVAHFAAGADPQHATPVTVRFRQLRCARD